MIKELIMINWNNYVVVFYVGCKGKSVEFKKGWKKKVRKVSFRNFNVGREFGKWNLGR